MSGVASAQREAKNAWTSAYPFESLTSGLGVRLSCTTTSGTTSRTALVGTGNMMILTNEGDVTVYVAWGTSSVVATTSYYPILAGTKEAVSLPADDSATHIAAITATGTATLFAHKGFGN